MRAPRPRPAPRPPAAPAQEGERRPSWRLITDGFTGAAPQPLPAGIGPDPPRVSGRGVTRRGRGGGGTRSRGRAGNTHSARHELVKSRAQLLPAEPTAAQGQRQSGLAGHQGERDTGGAPGSPRDPPGCSSSGAAFGLPLPLSSPLPFSRGCPERPEAAGSPGENGQGPQRLLRAGALRGRTELSPGLPEAPARPEPGRSHRSVGKCRANA